MTAPLTPAQIAAWRAEHTLSAHAREIADSHDRLSVECERLRAAYARWSAAVDNGPGSGIDDPDYPGPSDAECADHDREVGAAWDALIEELDALATPGKAQERAMPTDPTRCACGAVPLAEYRSGGYEVNDSIRGEEHAYGSCKREIKRCEPLGSLGPDPVATARAEGFRDGIERAAERCHEEERRCGEDPAYSAQVAKVACGRCAAAVRALVPVPDPAATAVRCGCHPGVAWTLETWGRECPISRAERERDEAERVAAALCSRCRALEAYDHHHRAAHSASGATGATLPPTETTRLRDAVVEAAETWLRGESCRCAGDCDSSCPWEQVQRALAVAVHDYQAASRATEAARRTPGEGA